MIRNCPNCHAPLQEEAHFCPHCMVKLDNKQQIEKPTNPKSNRRTKSRIVFAISIVILLVIGTVLTYAVVSKHKPICSYAQFTEATPLVSERMGIDSLWDVNGFKDIRTLKKQNCIQYTTDVYLNDAFLSLFFYNEGEEVYACLCDVKPEDLQNAEEILKCIVQGVCNYYFSDIDDIFDNEKLYPKKTWKTPFVSSLTNILDRTNSYEQFIANGGQISSNYIVMNHQDKNIAFCVTKRTQNDSVLYDLIVKIERA